MSIDEGLLALSAMNKQTFRQYQRYLRDNKMDSPETSKILPCSDAQEFIPRYLEEGAGFKKFVKSTLNLANPIHWVNTVKNVRNALKSQKEMKDIDHDYALMSQEVYLEPKRRSFTIKHGDEEWVHLGNEDDEDHSVYHRKKEGSDKYVLAIKGTNSKKDVLPDLAIIAGKQDRSKAFKRSLSKIQDKKNLRSFQLIAHIQDTGIIFPKFQKSSSNICEEVHVIDIFDSVVV